MGPAIHTMPLYPGMSIREAWQHIVDAGNDNPVPEFEREIALGRRPGWVNVAIEDGELLCSFDAAGDPVIDDLDEPFGAAA